MHVDSGRFRVLRVGQPPHHEGSCTGARDLLGAFFLRGCLVEGTLTFLSHWLVSCGCLWSIVLLCVGCFLEMFCDSPDVDPKLVLRILGLSGLWLSRQFSSALKGSPWDFWRGIQVSDLQLMLRTRCGGPRSIFSVWEYVLIRDAKVQSGSKKKILKVNESKLDVLEMAYRCSPS